jgi:general secretion pathway protein I
MRLLSLNRGFTLLEVLVAIAIIGIAVTVILQLFSSNLRALSVSKDYVHASIKAEEKMRELLEGELSEGYFSEQTDDGYRIDVNIRKVLEDKTENLQVEMIQIDLSVIWKVGLKEKRIDLTTSKVIEKEI